MTPDRVGRGSSRTLLLEQRFGVSVRVAPRSREPLTECLADFIPGYLFQALRYGHRLSRLDSEFNMTTSVCSIGSVGLPQTTR